MLKIGSVVMNYEDFEVVGIDESKYWTPPD
jgi:hypothetical protein